jgi:hypothetical protein
MESWELVARELIRETIARYAHLVDRGLLDELVGLFTEDATLEAGDAPPARGRTAIRDVFAGTGTRLAAATRPLIRHHVSNVLIEVDGTERAAASSYFVRLHGARPGPLGPLPGPLRSPGERWLFQHRRARADGGRRTLSSVARDQLHAAKSRHASPGGTPPRSSTGRPRRRTC